MNKSHNGHKIEKNEVKSNQNKTKKYNGPKGSSNQTVPNANHKNIRVEKETFKQLQNLLDHVNKKPKGRKIKPNALISLSLTLITEEHLNQLQEKSKSNFDRLELLFYDFKKKNPKTTFDQFLGNFLPQMSIEN